MQILRTVWVATVFIAAWMQITVAARAETRVALVVGEGAYTSPVLPRLPNPARDAMAIGGVLKNLGFDVEVVTDATKQTMEDALARLARKARDADLTVFFYAGHGIQDQGKNYIAPVDATLSDETDLRRRFVRLDDVLDDLADAKGARIILLDACRDNGAVEALREAVPRSRSAGINRGLARIPATVGQLVAFATQPDRVAADGEGADSPFTTALVAHLGEPGLELRTALTRVRVDVAKATDNIQIPEVSDSLLGEIYLRPQSAPAGPPITGLNAPALAPPGNAEANLPACVGGLVASIGNTGVGNSADRCLKPKDFFRDCEHCPEMVVIPAGRFAMGSPNSDKDRFANEGPPHDVMIDAALAIGKFEITRGEFSAFVNETGYNAGDSCWVDANGRFSDTKGRSFRHPGFGQDDTHPAVCISWEDAKAYAAWLANKTGKGYRLLSEAEYEYAARAGTTTRYPFGNDPKKLCSYGNGADLSLKGYSQFSSWTGVFACDDGYIFTAPVGSFAPNSFGLYDMSGNVWEWVDDCYHDGYSGAPTDGSTWISGNCDLRVVRGGAWNRVQRSFRSAYRSWNATDYRNWSYGFRVARALSP
jgi:formylglycine-generating enzyme required for sulfatase activity